MRKRKYKSVITRRIQEATKKLSLALFALVFSLSLYAVNGTNSTFLDTEQSAGNNFSAGTLDMEITSPSPAVNLDVQPGDDISASNNVENIGDLDFQYRVAFHKISGDDDLCSALILSAEKNGVSAYSGPLDLFSVNAGDLDFSDIDNWKYEITLPDDASEDLENMSCNFSFDFTAWQTDFSDDSEGFFDNESFTGNIIRSVQFEDTRCPLVEITNPDSGDNLSGSVEIRGTVTDANPHHYWLVVENSSGTKVAGPGTVNYPTSFTDGKLFDWNTGGVPDGNYKIKLEARDAAGNKCPDLSPVLEDPNDPSDSVDWINVTVNNSGEDKIVLNEIIPNPEGDDDVSKPGGEWVELYNLSKTKSYDLSGYRIEDAGGNAVAVEGCRTDTGGTTIGPEGFLVVYRKGSDTCNSHSFSLNDSGDTVKLFGKSGTLLDEYEYTVPSSTDLDADENNSLGSSNGSASGSETESQEGKSHARIPDGTGDWVDPIPTPGKKNKKGEVETEKNDPVSNETGGENLEPADPVPGIPSETDPADGTSGTLEPSGQAGETENDPEPVIIPVEVETPPAEVSEDKTVKPPEVEVKPEEEAEPEEKKEAPKEEVLISQIVNFGDIKIIYTLC